MQVKDARVLGFKHQLLLRVSELLHMKSTYRLVAVRTFPKAYLHDYENIA